jgi:hypothetical protein
MRRHPASSKEILSRIKAFCDLATIAGAHHELRTALDPECLAALKRSMARIDRTLAA